MNLGEFRLLTAGLPDDYEIVTTPGDATWWEVGDSDVLAPQLGAPGVVSLAGGQEITEQYAIPYRLDLDEWVELEWRHVPADHKQWEIWADESDPESEGEHWWPLAALPTDELLPDDIVCVRRIA